jgi:hypothetical protein
LAGNRKQGGRRQRVEELAVDDWQFEKSREQRGSWQSAIGKSRGQKAGSRWFAVEKRRKPDRLVYVSFMSSNLYHF